MDWEFKIRSKISAAEMFFLIQHVHLSRWLHYLQCNSTSVSQRQFSIALLYFILSVWKPLTSENNWIYRVTVRGKRRFPSLEQAQSNLLYLWGPWMTYIKHFCDNTWHEFKPMADQEVKLWILNIQLILIVSNVQLKSQ